MLYLQTCGGGTISSRLFWSRFFWSLPKLIFTRKNFSPPISLYIVEVNGWAQTLIICLKLSWLRSNITFLRTFLNSSIMEYFLRQKKSNQFTRSIFSSYVCYFILCHLCLWLHISGCLAKTAFETPRHKKAAYLFPPHTPISIFARNHLHEDISTK